MYLLHYSIVLQLMRYFVSSEDYTVLQKWAFSVSYFFVTILLSYLLYRLFEKPIMDIRDRGYFRRKYDVK